MKFAAVHKNSPQQGLRMVSQNKVLGYYKLKKLKDLANFRPREWYKNRKLTKKEREKEKRRRAAEQMPLRILTFAMTLISMMLSLSFMPLFPTELQVIISLLIAFAAFKSPIFGMPAGSLIIGLGLTYHLSRLNFIAMLGDPLIREIVIFVFLFLFVALPVVFHSYEAAVAIDIGIIAGMLLFFGQTYYLAMPLVLISAVLFKKTKSVLSMLYYVLISTPLQMMQFLNYVLTLHNSNWWLDPTVSPPLYAPLTAIFTDMQESMIQFRVIETSKVIGTILGQVTLTPGPPDRVQTMVDVLNRYADSLPGIILFLVIVVGLVSVTAFIARMPATKGYAMEAELLIPAATAAGVTALFFILLGGLQRPLAFTAEIDGTKMIVGTLAAVVFALPVSLANSVPKKRAAVEKRSKRIMEETKDLVAKLQVVELSLSTVKSSVPVDVSAIEGKTLILKDKLNDTLSNASARFYDPSEVNAKLDELDNELSKETNNLMSELNLALEEYQIYINCEYSTWTQKLKEIGLEVKFTAKTDFQRELPLETRIDLIKEVLDSGHSLANEVVQAVEQIYDIIRSLYDPSLPEESRAIAFAKEKLEEKKAPWIAIDALFASLNNWRKQYGDEISKSLDYLQSSLTSIANLSTQGEILLPVLGDNASKMMEHAKRADAIKTSIEKKTANVMNVTIIGEVLQSSLSIARDVLSILYEELKNEEESIESLLLTKDYLWEKNVTLKERMTSSMEIIFNSPKDELNQVMENLPKSVSYIDECVRTIAIYNEKKEFLLNYPIAEMAIENLLGQKKHISAQDLPFEPKYAEEYLRLFYSQRYREFSFDEANMLLMRKA
jgi:hypothetical protein